MKTAWSLTAQKMKFSIKDFCSKCDQIRSFQGIWSHLLEKSLMENFIFCAVLENHFSKCKFKMNRLIAENEQILKIFENQIEQYKQDFDLAQQDITKTLFQKILEKTLKEFHRKWIWNNNIIKMEANNC